MARLDKILTAMQRSQANVAFSDLCRVVESMGYVLRRTRGSHLIYRHETRPELPLINLQADGDKAKPYQVRQVLTIRDTFGLA